MILELILIPIFGLVSVFLSIVPAFDIPDTFTNAIGSIFDIIAGIGYFIPLDTFVVVLTVLMAIHFAEVIFAMIKWLLKKIPGLQ